MTPLLTRMRPFASHAARIRLAHRADVADRAHRADRAAPAAPAHGAVDAARPPLPATEERLATKSEIDLLLAPRARAV